MPVSGEFRLGAHLGESVVLGTGRDIGEALATANRKGEVERELLRYAAPMAFVVDDIRGRLAVMMRGSPESQQLSQVEESDLPIIEPDQLVVVDAADGSLVEVTRARNVAWFWSPDGDQLLYTTIEFLDGVEHQVLYIPGRGAPSRGICRAPARPGCATKGMDCAADGRLVAFPWLTSPPDGRPSVATTPS